MKFLVGLVLVGKNIYEWKAFICGPSDAPCVCFFHFAPFFTIRTILVINTDTP